MSNIKWMINPTNTPAIIRNCSKCGNGSKFICSGNFRVNANGRNIDVWLIYKCEECDTTWNMEILSREKPHHIEKSLYQCFLKNDYNTAVKYAFDAQTLSKNKAVVCYEEIAYEVEIENNTSENCSGEDILEVMSNYQVGLRLDKLLSEQLNISRTQIKKLFDEGKIISSDSIITAKSKIKGTIKLIFKENILS